MMNATETFISFKNLIAELVKKHNKPHPDSEGVQRAIRAKAFDDLRDLAITLNAELFAVTNELEHIKNTKSPRELLGAWLLAEPGRSYQKWSNEQSPYGIELWEDSDHYCGGGITEDEAILSAFDIYKVLNHE